MRIETDVKIERRIENIPARKKIVPRFDLQKDYKVDQPQVEVGLNAFSFNDELIDYAKGLGGGLSVFDLIDFCALHNIKALDLTAYYLIGYPDVPADNYLFEIKRYARKRNIHLSGTGVWNDFADPDPQRRKYFVRLIKNWIEASSKMGIEVIRVFSGVPPEGYTEEKRPEIVSQIVECLKECAVHAGKYGIMIGLQHHADMLRTADETIEMIKKIDSPWVAVILDTGNLISEDPYADMDKLMPYVISWQLKESVFGWNLSVRTDLKKIMQIIRKHNYRGYLPVETLNTGICKYDPYEQVPRFINEVRQAIASAF